MASSAKKKKEKKKDFQKTQLKVGKTKSKASNFTDTSFKAKSIVIQTQSLTVNAPTATSQFAHHVSLLKSRSDTQRAESLAFLTTVMATQSKLTSLPESTVTLLPKLQPLLLDPSAKVRQQLLKLLQCLPKEDIRSNAEQLLLYLHATMTSLHSGIRSYSLDLLEWLLDSAGQEVVGCAGGWIKTMNCFQGLLGWLNPTDNRNGWKSQRTPNTRPELGNKILKRQIKVLIRLIEVGLGSPHASAQSHKSRMDFPLKNAYQHMLPDRANAFAYLDLYAAPRDDLSLLLEDEEDRRRVFAERFAKPFAQGITTAVKEGGEIGRAAALLRQVIENGMAGHDDEGSPS